MVITEEDEETVTTGECLSHLETFRLIKKRHAWVADSPQFPHLLGEIEAPPAKGCRRKNEIIHVQYLA